MDTVVHHISSDTTWTDSTVVNYTINIDSGACLTISAYVAFAPETRFIVNRGGKLIIDGGHLTKACPELWNGLEVFGQDTSQLMESYFGVVIVKNKALIENAKIGIANYCTVGDTTNEYNGGIIRAEFSTFLNYEIDIQLAPFVNSWQGHEIPYSARIKKCNFLTTDSFYPDYVPLSHIDMQDVFGVMLFGCVFRNESGFDYQPYPIRGIGINSIDANYMLQQYCNDTNVTPCINVDSCIFQRLEYGVKAINALSSRTLSFSKIKFDENLVGISLSGINYAEVISNDFELTKCKEYTVPDRFNGGLFLEGCTGYHIEDDSCYAFLPPMTGGQSPFYGFGIKNSGPSDNEIYNNQFSHLEAGMICIGENRGRDTSGLCLKCNDMYENINDFLVVVDDGPPTGIQGIKIIQGVPYDTVSITAPAGNTFTLMDSIANPENITHYNYYNSAEDICYLHHQRQIYPLTYPTDTNYTNETIELHLINVGFQKPLACPSGIGEENELKNYSSPRQCIIDADNHISLLKIELNALVDGGNTDELNFDVMTSLPEDGEEIWLELLSDSPYLSDTVIKQAIFKEDVLPNAMIRDIMEANPQSAKKDEFFEALDNRYEPMPDYLIAQIMEGKNYFGAKEILEAQITSWQQIRSKAKHELMREFLLDTNVINPVDSIIAFLETENDIRSKYDLAFAYWEKKDTAYAMAILNYIPAQFDLDEDQELTHQQYIDFFEILDQMAENHWNANDLDSSFVEDVYYLMENGDVKLAAHARGILVKGGFLKYIETVELPAYTKSSETMPYASGKIKNEIETDYLRLFPNPAGDYVIAYYNIEAEALSGVITIIDIKGNLLKRYNVKQSENQIVIDLKNLPNGLYIIGLYLDNRLLEAEKLSKGKN